jgi:hypothetical protein
MTIETPTLDEALWFHHQGCSGKHYFLGNPHTFHGRMMAWCPLKTRSFFVSKSEILEASSEAKYWIAGFLAGAEPEPPRNANQDVDFKSPEYRKWEQRVTEFRRTGSWPNTNDADA